MSRGEPGERGRVVAVADALMALALTAWVGGHAALGAFAARIVFRDLPRALAAPTMNAIFRSFDGLIIGAVLVLAASAAARAWAVRPLGKNADALVTVAAVLLVLLGALEVGYVTPRISEMFLAGRTLEPAFASLHHLSERCGHLEVLLTAALVGGQAWARVR
jgi:hypothetical protein